MYVCPLSHLLIVPHPPGELPVHEEVCGEWPHHAHAEGVGSQDHSAHPARPAQHPVPARMHQ